MGKTTAIILADTESSRVMLIRVRLMARFISERHLDEFGDYWREQYSSKADPWETVNYWAQNDLENTLVLEKKTQI